MFQTRSNNFDRNAGSVANQESLSTLQPLNHFDFILFQTEAVSQQVERNRLGSHNHAKRTGIKDCLSIGTVIQCEEVRQLLRHCHNSATHAPECFEHLQNRLSGCFWSALSYKAPDLVYKDSFVLCPVLFNFIVNQIQGNVHSNRQHLFVFLKC